MSPYNIEGLALGARVEFGALTSRAYQCSPSEQFPELTWCQRTQKQQDGGARRFFDRTNSILHARDGKAVYINRYIAPLVFDRNEVQNEINKLSTRFGERARETRMSQLEGLPNAIIAMWGKIQLEQLDVDAISILASGESPRKGLLIDYLGNFRRSAQLGLPVYRLDGGAGYLWSASVDRNGRGHLRFLALDASELTPATTTKRTAVETWDTEKVAPEDTRTNTEPARLQAQEARVDQVEIKEATAQEEAKVDPLVARLKSDLATAEVKSSAMETLAYRAIASLVVVLIIVISLLLLRRKKANAAKRQIYKSEIKRLNLAVPQSIQASSPGCESEMLQQKSVAANANASHEAFIRNEVRFQSGDEHEKELAAAGERNNENVGPLVSNLRPCAHCNREISIENRFCMHCGVSVGSSVAETTRLCSSCHHEIGTSDNFCRHCGASSIPVATPAKKRQRGSRAPRQAVEQQPNHVAKVSAAN